MIVNSAVDANERMKSSVGREIGVLQHIRHPLLVGLLSAFETTDTTHTVIVLEHVQGGELFDLVSKCHSLFTDEFLRRAIDELQNAVGWMHKLGLVHRDLKLENILLTTPLFINSSTELPPKTEPMIKITDFGLSRFIDFSSPLLTTRCGSEEYAAPELILGKQYDGRRTDVWALGVVIYALIIGKLPFEGDSRRKMLVKIAKGVYDWPMKSTQKDLKEVVEKMLVREPDSRIKLEDISLNQVWDLEAVGKRPVEGSDAARFLAGEILPPTPDS
ncbi:hypothetical protein CROQUDRAFT_48471 [Cronartium quercuum f. sp. fusiforme G11]|uniref:Protein kinase domain-containing protein n=1 Tax=Cronartium quercuum f. sp. fusiforme G11 TaxID=708437 RepID=A0A9P6T8Z9_9BASI|nr:hypothetical protein CROQUDRAFT_48471 [Cronartium quercuum f. sp. fusiforme G11]